MWWSPAHTAGSTAGALNNPVSLSLIRNKIKSLLESQAGRWGLSQEYSYRDPSLHGRWPLKAASYWKSRATLAGQELLQMLLHWCSSHLHGTVLKIPKRYSMCWLRMSMRTSQRKVKQPIFMHEGRSWGRLRSQSSFSLCQNCSKAWHGHNCDEFIFLKSPAKPFFMLTSVTQFFSCSLLTSTVLLGTLSSIHHLPSIHSSNPSSCRPYSSSLHHPSLHPPSSAPLIHPELPMAKGNSQSTHLPGGKSRKSP